MSPIADLPLTTRGPRLTLTRAAFEWWLNDHGITMPTSLRVHLVSCTCGTPTCLGWRFEHCDRPQDQHADDRGPV